MTGRGKYYSINKHGVVEAYRKIVKAVYGGKADEVLEKHPVPHIDESDMYKRSFESQTGVYGVGLSIVNKYRLTSNSYLIGFHIYDKMEKKSIHFSIRKYGLEEAWRRAVEALYSMYEPLETDNTELSPEWWDMINPNQKYKTR